MNILYSIRIVVLVLFSAIDKTLEVMHTGVLHQITGKRERQNPYEMWVEPAPGDVQEAAGMKS